MLYLIDIGPVFMRYLAQMPWGHPLPTWQCKYLIPILRDFKKWDLSALLHTKCHVLRYPNANHNLQKDRSIPVDHQNLRRPVPRTIAGFHGSRGISSKRECDRGEQGCSCGVQGIDAMTDHLGKNHHSGFDRNSRAAATLAAGATFQGVSEDVSNYGRVGIAIYSENATDGVLWVEVSHDGVTWFGPPRKFANTNIATPHMWNIVEKYFRIRYVNGTTEATNLSIQVQYSSNADTTLVHELNEVIPNESEATLVRVGTTFDLEASRQHIRGTAAEFFFGFNNDVGTSWEDIHPQGGDITWLTVATKVEVLSSHAADNGTTPGLGLHSVEIHGLSATGEDQDEVILLNGTAAVESTLTYIRVNIVHSEKCGTYGGSHRGDITCRVTGGGAVLSTMTGAEGAAGSSVQYGEGEAGNGFYSVPLGKIMYITRIEVIPDVSGNKTVDIALYEREDLLDIVSPFSPRRVLWQENGVDKSTEKPVKSHIKVKPLADIWFRAKATGASKIEVHVDFYLLNEDDSGR